MHMSKLSKKHWIAFFIIVLFELAFSAAFSMFDGNALSNPYAISGSLLCIVLIRFYLKEPAAEYGLHFKKPHVQLCYALALTLIIMFLSFYYKISECNLSLLFTESFAMYIMGTFSLSYFFNLLVNVAYEEILFRGFFLSFLWRLSGRPALGVIISAAMFGLIHYTTLHNPAESWSRVFSAFSIALVYGYLRVKDPERFSLFSLTAAHFLNDTIALALSYCFFS